MIKYLELTAPTTSAFRQSKIVSIECAEGEHIKQGSTLFRVKSGKQEIDLPSTHEGRVVELIAAVGESITLSTALLLLETEVEGSTATPPITPDDAAPVYADAASQSPDQGSNKIQASAVEPQPNQTPASTTQANKTTKLAEQNESPQTSNSKQQALDLMADNFELPQDVTPQPQSNVSSKTTFKKKSQTSAVSKTMSSNSTIEVTVPDIGADSAKVIEILVNVGDAIGAEDPLITLESDKASMDVPSTHAGVVSAIKVSLDQDVGEGAVIIELTTQEDIGDSSDNNNSKDNQESPEQAITQDIQQDARASSATKSTLAKEIEVVIPDIGGDSAKVIEILVAVGDQVGIEDALVTLESDKASMDVPSSAAGEITSIEVDLDQDVSEGTIVVKLLSASVAAAPVGHHKPTQPTAHSQASSASSTGSDNTKSIANTDKEASAVAQSSSSEPLSASASASAPAPAPAGKSHASPSIRRFARELGVDISKVGGSGRKDRVTKDDVKGFVKGIMTGTAVATAQTSSGAGIPPIPEQDFSKFGEIEVQPLNKIKRLTATNLHRSWLNVPHVTHNDEANISDLESFRKELNAEAAKQENGIKLSPLAFVVKAVVHGLRHYPQFNSSLDSSGENLILKKYVNIGIAVETPNGLVVPVLRDADTKSISEIAKEMGALAAKARDKKLTMADMSGACFTISSLGGIGGTSFTPIVNAPEVAILGVSRSKIEPKWNGEEFKPGIMLPLSLSYDHRVIDGAEAARFTRHVAAALEDVRRLTI